MNPEKKFDAFFTCVIGDPSLKEFLEDLIDSNVLSVIYPPVKLSLVKSCESWLLKITDGFNCFVLHPNDIDDNMLQDIEKAYSKYKPDESDSESSYSDEEIELAKRESLKNEFMKGYVNKGYKDI